MNYHVHVQTQNFEITYWWKLEITIVNYLNKNSKDIFSVKLML